LSICSQHGDQAELTAYEIWRNDLWLLRYLPRPAPLIGWRLLDSRRNCGGPINFATEEAQDWGVVVQRASQLVRQAKGCEMAYASLSGREPDICISSHVRLMIHAPALGGLLISIAMLKWERSLQHLLGV
tara:strand:- start:418 stop:807 length:390 start_codon:yes stop_codon:yes gene_type:complete